MFAIALLALAAPSPQEPCGLEPLFSTSGVTLDRFGEVVRIDGDRMLVTASGWNGSFLRQGAAYLFEWNGSDWVETAFFEASDPQQDARFGASAAIQGDTIVIGANEAATAYMFELVGGVWTETQRITSSHSATTSFRFGASMDIDGDRLVIGDPIDSIAGPGGGAAFLFERSAGQWVEQQVLMTRDSGPFGWFGHSVAIDGDRIMVSRPLLDGTGIYEGAVYVFERIGGLYTELAKLEPDAGDPGRFGWSVDFHGDQAAIGAFTSENGGVASGAVYVFEGSGASWTRVQKIVSPEAAEDDFFGWRVRMDEDRLLVAAPLDDLGYANSGTVYRFSPSGSNWTYGGRWTSGVAGSVAYGRDLDSDEDRTVVGIEQAVPGIVSGVALAYESPVTIAPYCFAGPCPCGNVDEFGSCVNSTGVGATLSGCGTTSLASDDMVLRAEGIPANQFGILFMGGLPASTVLGDGVRCVGGSLFRYPAQNSGAGGTFTEGPGVAAFASANFPQSGQIVSGSTWYFGAWYRDPLGPCGTGNNMTNGVRVTFTP